MREAKRRRVEEREADMDGVVGAGEEHVVYADTVYLYSTVSLMSTDNSRESSICYDIFDQ